MSKKLLKVIRNFRVWFLFNFYIILWFYFFFSIIICVKLQNSDCQNSQFSVWIKQSNLTFKVTICEQPYQLTVFFFHWKFHNVSNCIFQLEIFLLPNNSNNLDQQVEKEKKVKPPKPGRTKTAVRFVCKKCKPNSSFGRAWDLKVHDESKHLNLKRYKCEYQGCKHSCSVPSNLTKHIKNVHLKIKPHKCQNYPNCDAAFAYKRDLQFHIEAVHLNIVHKWQSCEVTFTDKKNLRKHAKKNHKNWIEVKVFSHIFSKKTHIYMK